MKNAIKEKNGKSVARETVKTAMIILLVVVTAGAVCAGIAFARNGRIQIATSTENSQSAQAMKVAQAADVQTQDLVDNENMTVETDASGDKVPVPRGYVGSQATGENEIDTGYVIYEGEDPVTDANVAEAQKTRNQYVWVPVPDASKMYGTDSSGKKWGKIYYFIETDPGFDWNYDYDEVTGACSMWIERDGIMTMRYGEPAVLVAKYSDAEPADFNSDFKQYGLGPMSKHEFLVEMEEDFNKMIESIEKYGGFYMGRYETGNLSQDVAVVQKENTDINNQTWYTMYKKCKALKGANKQVETGLMWGNQYYRTLMWLIESGNKTKEEICSDSTSWGNYNNATFTYVNTSGKTSTKNQNSSIIIPTGSADYTKANNIYDLAGNVSEWTMLGDSVMRETVGGRYSRRGDEDIVGSYLAGASSDYKHQVRRLPNSTLYKVILNIGSNKA